MRYELAVIGNDEAAVDLLLMTATTKLRSVAILPESRHSVWISALALRRLVSELLVDNSAARRRTLRRTGSPAILRRLLARALASEISDMTQMLESAGVHVVLGEARFRSRDTLDVATGINLGRTVVRASNFVIGTGVCQTSVHRPLGLLPFHRPESLFTGVRLPQSLCIIGGGGLGAGLSALFSLFGVSTSLLTREADACVLVELAESAGVRVGFHLSEPGLTGDSFSAADLDRIADFRRAVGFTENLNLSIIGVTPDENGQLWCADNFETWCPGIFGIGDVVGFSSVPRLPPLRQAERVLTGLTQPFRIEAPHYLGTRVRRSVSV